jgi:hypothetical protein
MNLGFDLADAAVTRGVKEGLAFIRQEKIKFPGRQERKPLPISVVPSGKIQRAASARAPADAAWVKIGSVGCPSKLSSENATPLRV